MRDNKAPFMELWVALVWGLLGVRWLIIMDAEHYWERAVGIICLVLAAQFYSSWAAGFDSYCLSKNWETRDE